MAGVFISYRRDDSAADAGRLFDDIKHRCSPDLVFMDLIIPPGIDFREVLSEKLDSCDVLLALIGPRWLDATEDGGSTRRLERPDDYVRLEIATALMKGKKVVPVLLPGAKIPRASQLPEAIEELASRQAFELDRRRWRTDLDELLTHLPAELGCTRGTGFGKSRGTLGNVVVLPITLLVAVHVFAVFNLTSDPHTLSIALSLLTGIAHSVKLDLGLWQKALTALAIGFAAGVLVSVLVPVLAQQEIIPRTGVAWRWFFTYVASIVIGYLVGALTTEVVQAIVRGGRVR